MAYTVRKRKDYLKRAVSGDRAIASDPAKTAGALDTTASEQLLIQEESLYDDEVSIALLEQTEKDLRALEDLVTAAMEEFVVVIDPDQTPLVQAASVLKGDPTILLTGEIIIRALDLAFDGSIHGGGFDPVATILGFHGGNDAMPNSPKTILLSDCASMQRLENLPSPGDAEYEPTPIDEISIETQQTQALSILSKLWMLLKYFPGLALVAMLKKLKKRPIKKIIRRVIKWVNCRMVYPALYLLTGEAKKCLPEEEADDDLDVGDEVFLDSDDIIAGRGLDCLESSAVVLTYCDNSLRTNKDLQNLFTSYEQRAEHEALKFGTLSNIVRNTEYYGDRIDALYESTKNSPRYKKRFYDHKDALSPSKFFMMSKEDYELQINQ